VAEVKAGKKLGKGQVIGFHTEKSSDSGIASHKVFCMVVMLLL
jgi:hypothetical protein